MKKNLLNKLEIYSGGIYMRLSLDYYYNMRGWNKIKKNALQKERGVQNITDNETHKNPRLKNMSCYQDGVLDQVK